MASLMPQHDPELAREYNRAYVAAHPEQREKARERKARYMQQDPKWKHNQHIRNRYGITPEEYELAYKHQEGLCAICGVTSVSDIDHDHETGQVRGLLCRSCNVGLGFFRDDTTRLEAAIAYLTSGGTWPA